MSADKGDTESMHRYADIFFNGDGIPANQEEAMKYY